MSGTSHTVRTRIPIALSIAFGGAIAVLAIFNIDAMRVAGVGGVALSVLWAISGVFGIKQAPHRTPSDNGGREDLSPLSASDVDWLHQDQDDATQNGSSHGDLAELTLPRKP